MKNLNSGGTKSGKMSAKELRRIYDLCSKDPKIDMAELKKIYKKMVIDPEIDYAKDKFASENFLDSLLFWIVLVILTIAYILWKNYPK